MLLLELLKKHCEVARDHFESKAFVLKFNSDGVTVSIGVAFEDKQSGADMVITNMTTLPTELQRKGFGSKALKTLLGLSAFFGVRSIQAVQVQPNSEMFWKKMVS